MRNLLWVLLIGVFAPIAVPILATAAERPDWAFPVTDKVQPPLPPDEQPHTVLGSDKSYTRKQIDDLFNPPDWYPDLHPPMPPIVAHGESTTVRACASCHLPTGTGHDESAYIAALPAGYFVRQMID
jgi:cytochrome c553